MSVIKFLCLVFGLTLSSVYAQEKQAILFVCEHGAARSVIAAAYFNKLAKERGLNYEASFKGTDPQDSLTFGTKHGLMKDGFDVSKMKPALVSQKDISNAAKVVTFNCRLPGSPQTKNSEQWNGIPPISESYQVARDEIVKKVDALINQLLKGEK